MIRISNIRGSVCLSEEDKRGGRCRQAVGIIDAVGIINAVKNAVKDAVKAVIPAPTSAPTATTPALEVVAMNCDGGCSCPANFKYDPHRTLPMVCVRPAEAETAAPT